MVIIWGSLRVVAAGVGLALAGDTRKSVGALAVLISV